jgi:2-polyprenyl-3-methyl-5-hydroxy-6-metoxy-1,4-benzoquinol methylase
MSTHLPYQDKVSAWSSHSLIAKQINALPPQSKVLDVGTASGTLARMCQHRPLRLFGIEPNKSWAQTAAPFYEKMWVASITEIATNSLTGYEAVVLADILEHLPNPRAMLQRLVDAQSSGSLFLISVPNIANIWIRLSLLFGRFDYTDRGILDRTHLYFFTRKTLIAMVKDTGLEIVSIQVSPIPLELVSAFFITTPGKWIHTGWAAVTKLFPTLLGYQFIVSARKP